MNDPKGAIFFWEDDPFITGFLTVGDDHYELVGVRRSKVRTDFTAKKHQRQEVQTDMFDDRSGDGEA